MPYPDELLASDEHIVMHKHPHWKMLVIPVLGFLLIVALCSYAAAFIAGQPWQVYGWITLVGLGAVVIGWFTIAPLLRWRTTHFVVTNRRVLVREGVLTRSGIDIALDRINTVQFRRTFFERLLGCGTLSIESASDEPLEFDNIPDVEAVHAVLYQQVNPDPPAPRASRWRR